MLGIYRFKNIFGEIIYIGKSQNISIRQKQHFGKEGHLPIECYNETVYIEFTELQSKTEMEMYEIYFINKYAPKYNTKHNYHEFNISFALPELNWKPYIPKENLHTIKNTNSTDDFSIRTITNSELDNIIKILYKDVKFRNSDGRKSRIEANEQIALILIIQATTGLKISEVLKIKVNDIKENYLSISYSKDKSTSSKVLSSQCLEALNNYIFNINLKEDDFLFNTTPRNVQLRLKKVSDYLGYTNISTHSFRKFYAINAYENSNHDLEFIRKLLNHSSVSITQRYLNATEKDTNEHSSNITLFQDNASEVN